MHEVELIEVTHRYGSKTALESVSLGIREKSITAIIGRSGSGKSTLIRTINGLVSPTQGTVKVKGTVVQGDLLTLRRSIGYVVQGNGLFPHLTVAANVFLPARIRGQRWSPESRVLVRETLKLVDLDEDYLNRMPRHLSGGEQQRVALARALFTKPSLLLMDEPFGSLDPLSRKEMNEMLLRLQSVIPSTIVIITHDVQEARRIADDIIVIDQGQIVQAASKDIVIHQPASQLVADLIQTSVA